MNPCSGGLLDDADGAECCNNDLDNSVYDNMSEDDKELIRQKSRNSCPGVRKFLTFGLNRRRTTFIKSFLFDIQFDGLGPTCGFF